MGDAAAPTTVPATSPDKHAQMYGGLPKKTVNAHLKTRLEGKKRFDSADYQMAQTRAKPPVAASALGNATNPAPAVSATNE